MNAIGAHAGGSQMQRVDLGAMRKRILTALGPEKARRYWDTLKRFTRFKLSKEELDATAKEVLGADNIPLHNDFIRGVFQNALLGTLSPPATEVVLDDPLEPGGRPSKKPKKKVTPQGQVVVQGPQSKAMVAQGAQRRDLPPGVSQDQIWVTSQELHRMQWRICDGADLYDESWELPSLVGVRHKMRRRCEEQGLSVHADAIECMHKTVELYIKNMVVACMEVSKLRRAMSPSG
eukprot:CAMPEP_0173435816 /NCGR_PEP_ID=MMETSP1357-20121228/15604_1 /TAXON_ID=77926 /ORGANISM="Hemiselmis rufescens, Strain PCC563" /LENGTH=233 /DNA_ID=CAMNT_0014400843 /DNA_START=178 /DNA_END=875 /DNA_ORIENTATION=+